VVDGLTEHMARRPDATLVFGRPDGRYLYSPRFRTDIWHPTVQRLGLAPLRIHGLRHTAVAFWIAAGASPKEIAARAGHTSVAVVLDRYGHRLPGSEDAVNAALDRLAASAQVAPLAEVIPLARDGRGTRHA
jgi:integrase